MFNLLIAANLNEIYAASGFWAFFAGRNNFENFKLSIKRGLLFHMEHADRAKFYYSQIILQWVLSSIHILCQMDVYLFIFIWTAACRRRLSSLLSQNYNKP